ncbi:hypothetical protein [Vibrio cyclitrophicus]|uniref:hypothetical protein n=1 Tax=Vibrio cyclitrophicus TaxID=47951 RepID=UPI0002E4A06D|nr:hypothetical protein [Vibrio cyclitrophicus]OBT29239.1 hypothetical protein A9263_04050 [Vibrio cyclitrophicus]
METNISFKDRILKISCEDHYLRQVSNNYDSYIDELNSIINNLTSVMSNNQIDVLLDKKLQLSANTFNEAQFIQTVCELASMNEFIANDAINFSYEKKVTPPKDVDFSIESEGRTFNVEVKCPSFTNKAGKDHITLSSMDRTPDKKDTIEIINDLKSRLKSSKKDIHVQKSMDNNLKDFLLSTQHKVINASDNDINILIVACDSAVDMQVWRGYLFGASGLFTDGGFIPHSEFDRVDYVLLTNLYNRHHKFFEPSILSARWELSKSFCLLYPNKYSKRNKKVIDGQADFKFVSSIFDNFSQKFEEYLKNESDMPNSDESFEMKKFLGVAWFSDKYRDKGIYHFQESKGI